MSRRFINCSACRGCHTGRGGQFCKFTSPQAKTAGTMAMAQHVPDRDSPDYQDYLTEQIEEEESRLKQLKEKCCVTTMEEQLARLRLESAELQAASTLPATTVNTSDALAKETGVAADLLAAQRGSPPVSLAGHSPSSASSPQTSHAANMAKPNYMQCPKEDREMLCKLKSMSHLSEPKTPE